MSLMKVSQSVECEVSGAASAEKKRRSTNINFDENSSAKTITDYMIQDAFFQEHNVLLQLGKCIS